MTEAALDQLRYPVGKFVNPGEYDRKQLGEFISVIENLPAKLRREVGGLSDEQLDTPYRPGGWTLRQVVHHLADSHMNAFIRFKLALTEDKPVIKPYKEAAWAELPDAKNISIDTSLGILDGIHARWIILLKSLTDAERKRTFFHPEKGRELDLDETIALYTWHSRHHLAHITVLKEMNGWK